MSESLYNLPENKDIPIIAHGSHGCFIIWQNPLVSFLLRESRRKFARGFKAEHGRYPGWHDEELMDFLDQEERKIRRRLGILKNGFKVFEGKGQGRLF